MSVIESVMQRTVKDAKPSIIKEICLDMPIPIKPNMHVKNNKKPPIQITGRHYIGVK